MSQNSRLANLIDNNRMPNQPLYSQYPNDFTYNLDRNPYLISVDVGDPNNVSMQGGPNRKKKKEIISYVANRDTLYIPHPEKPKEKIETGKNLIEDKKIVKMTNLGMQSDVFIEPPKQEIYVLEPNKNGEMVYVEKVPLNKRQKTGRDVSTQIEDGELFNFDRDVEQILTVLLGKIREQTDLELREEEEINRLRADKANFQKKLLEERLRLTKIEEEEINKKKENDLNKKAKKADKNTRIIIQKKFISRLYAKNLLTGIKEKTLEALEKKGVFKEYLEETLKDKILSFTYNKVEDRDVKHKKLKDLVSSVKSNILVSKKDNHVEKIMKRQEEIRLQKEQEAKIAEEEKQERIKKQKRLEFLREERRIQLLKEDIVKTIFDVAVAKGEYANEDVSEIDNYNQDAPYVGILGGFMGVYIITMSLCKANIIKADMYYGSETIQELLTTIFAECGKVTISFSDDCEAALKNINPEIDLQNFKESTSNLEPEDWVKVTNILSQESMIGDIFLKYVIEQNKSQIDMSFYVNCIKNIMQMVEKGQNVDRIQFMFQKTDTSLTEKLKSYEAILTYEMTEDWNDLLESTEYLRDPKKKKAMRLPNFMTETSAAKFMQKTPEHNILIYNKYGEFFFRNKMIENILKTIYGRFEINDIESKREFIRFNELYDELLKNITCFDDSENIMKVDYKKMPEEEVEMDDANNNN